MSQNEARIYLMRFYVYLSFSKQTSDLRGQPFVYYLQSQEIFLWRVLSESEKKKISVEEDVKFKRYTDKNVFDQLKKFATKNG